MGRTLGRVIMEDSPIVKYLYVFLQADIALLKRKILLGTLSLRSKLHKTTSHIQKVELETRDFFPDVRPEIGDPSHR